MGRNMDPVVHDLTQESRSRFETLLTQRWALPGGHPLEALHGAALGAYRLLVLLGPKSSVGSQSFQLLLSDARGTLADVPLAVGLHNRGPYPAYNWIELTRYDSRLVVEGRELDLAGEGLELALFEMLSSLVPAGGHLMVEYDSPSQRATERVLTLGYPEVCSPTGYLLFQVGCRSYKNWHISEGWREGPRKLQGFKPWSEEISREKSERLRSEVSALLERPPNVQHGEWGEIARRNAVAVLEALATES
jgi:hypothetical protein